MEAYLEKLLSQIRCKKARPFISEEIKRHIEDQIAENLTEGMDAKTAEEKAVEDMGDPVQVGISLDKIHKPKVEWKLLAIVGILSLLGILIQQSIYYHATNYGGADQMQATLQPTMTGFVASVVLGFIIMCCIYFVDYTTVAKYSKVIGFGIIVLCMLCAAGVLGWTVHGARFYIGFGMVRVSAVSLLLFYIPIYGAILYKYRNGGVGALFMSLVWLVVPVVIAFRLPNIVTSVILMVSMLIQLTAAIKKGWYRVPVKRTIAILWTASIILPLISLFTMYSLHLLAAYQEARLQAYFTRSGDAFYLTSVLRSLSENVAWFGKSGNDVIGILRDVNSDYIFSYIINSYGSMAGMLVIGILASLVAFIFAAAVNQKNELGVVMGIGCGMVLLLNIVLNLFGSLGWIPPASSFLPFFSVGRSNMVLCYALVGFVISIYRYKEVYPRHVKTTQVEFKKELTIKINL